MYLIIILAILTIIGIAVIKQADSNFTWSLSFFLIFISASLLLFSIACVAGAHSNASIREYDRVSATVKMMSKEEIFNSPGISKKIDEVNANVQSAKWAKTKWVLQGTYNKQLAERDYLLINSDDANKDFGKQRANN